MHHEAAAGMHMHVPCTIVPEQVPSAAGIKHPVDLDVGNGVGNSLTLVRASLTLP